MTDRRNFIGASGALLAVPALIRAQAAPALGFATIPDPDGWHPSLRLKGDWLVFTVSDGVLTGYGEASHSRDDEGCRAAARRIFERYYRGFSPSLESLAQMEAEIAEQQPEFVDATAFSGINQAFYDLLAKQEQVAVWELFADRVETDSVPLYTTINRALQSRKAQEYSVIAAEVSRRRFGTLKCAPFEAVASPALGLTHSGPGLAVLEQLREHFPDLGIRVDFHERFRPDDFYSLVPRFEGIGLDWLEEPFAMGDDYNELRRRTPLRVAGGELFWGRDTFANIAASGWVDVIMPDVKHVGGFGPLLDVISATRDRVEISPHNPSGPISTAASLHAAVLNPGAVHSLEYAYDRERKRAATGEIVEDGRLWLNGLPGWGVSLPELAR